MHVEAQASGAGRKTGPFPFPAATGSGRSGRRGGIQESYDKLRELLVYFPTRMP